MPGKKKSSSKNATEGASQTPTLSQSTLSFGTNATPVVKRKASDSVPAPASKLSRKRIVVDDGGLNLPEYLKQARAICSKIRVSTRKSDKQRQEERNASGRSVTPVLPATVGDNEVVMTTWNVNGIRACIRSNFLEIIKSWVPASDLIFLQEIKASENDMQELVTDLNAIGYEIFFNSGYAAGYSGTALIYKSTMKPLQVTGSNIFGDDMQAPKSSTTVASDASDASDASNIPDTKLMWDVAEQEGRIVTAEFKDYYAVGVYTPNSGQKLERLRFRERCWDPSMKLYLNKLNEKKPVVYCGDLNVAYTEFDVYSPESNFGTAGYTVEERQGMSNLLEEESSSSGFTDAFTKLYGKDILAPYTFWGYRAGGRTAGRGWRIDYFLLSKKYENNIRAIAVGHEFLSGKSADRASDHAPVHLIFNPDPTQTVEPFTPPGFKKTELPKPAEAETV